jgi:hypothetical protein
MPPGTTHGADGGEPERVCGNCGLWGPNFYSRHSFQTVNVTCAADAVMDLPASFIPNRQTMKAGDGAGCCAWRAVSDFAEAAIAKATPAQSEDTSARPAMGGGSSVAESAWTGPVAHLATEAEPSGPFQPRVEPWMRECFGDVIPFDKVERGDRLLEEVFELLQSCGYDPDRVLELRRYVWGRPVGEPAQELGGVMVTLAAYSLAFGLDMHGAGETELARIWTKVEAIRAKQAAKPRGIACPIDPALSASTARPASAQPHRLDDQKQEHNQQAGGEG